MTSIDFLLATIHEFRSGRKYNMKSNATGLNIVNLAYKFLGLKE